MSALNELKIVGKRQGRDDAYLFNFTPATEWRARHDPAFLSLVRDLYKPTSSYIPFSDRLLYHELSVH
jgi:hypothetical protein